MRKCCVFRPGIGIVVGSLLASVVPSLADQVVLKNGDRVTGSVVKKDDQNLTFKSDVFGNITLPWDKVESLSAEQPLFVVLPDQSTVLATITPKQDRVEILTAEATRVSSLTDLRTIRSIEEQNAYERMLKPGWTELWSGTATLGWAGVRGNAKTVTFTGGFNATRITHTDKTTAQLNAIRSSATVDGLSSPTAEAIRGGWGYNRNFGSRFTWNTFNDYESDRFQNLDLRFVLGGGLGVNVWKGERGRLELVGGGAYNHEAFSATAIAPLFTRNSAEAYVGDEFTFRLSPVTSVYQSSRTFANLTETGDIRINFDLGTNTRLFRWLTWNASVSNRYLSNPVPGKKRNDFLYSTGIGVSFSH